MGLFTILFGTILVWQFSSLCNTSFAHLGGFNIQSTPKRAYRPHCIFYRILNGVHCMYRGISLFLYSVSIPYIVYTRFKFHIAK